MNIIVKEYKYDGLIYNLNDDGTAEFVGTEIEGAIIIPETISMGNANYTVTSLNCPTLKDCKNLIRIRMPKSVISCTNTLCSCQNLNCIEVQHDNTKFTTIDGVLFDKEITTLIAYPAGKPDEQYSIPNTVSNIESRAFSWCTNLKSVSIPNSVTNIGQWAFWQCTSLKCISIPNSVTSIEQDAFVWCTSLKSVSIPNSVTNIGQSAFQNCTDLQSVSIPNSVTNIGQSAFQNCTDLQSVSIPNSVTNIEKLGFSGCTNLKSISVEEENPYYASKDGVLFNKELTTLIAYPAGKPDEQYSIPNSVTNIGQWAFVACTSLKSISIPNSVTNIGQLAFAGCTSLKSISIPNSVTNIGQWAFGKCTNLKSIGVEEENPYYASKDGVLFNKGLTTLIVYPAGKLDEQYSIPRCVTNIERRAFNGCTNLNSIMIESTATYFRLDISNLKEIICKAILPPIIEFDFFVNKEIYSTCTLYVPDTSLEDYKWSRYRWSYFRNILPISKYPTKRIYTANGTEVTEDLLLLAPGTYIVKEGVKSREIVIR